MRLVGRSRRIESLEKLHDLSAARAEKIPEQRLTRLLAAT